MIELTEVIEDCGNFTIGRTAADDRLWLTWRNGEAGGWITINGYKGGGLDGVVPPLNGSLKRLIAGVY